MRRGMTKRTRKTLPPDATWTCPHCARVHTAADLLRLDSERIRCKGCSEPFSSIPDGVERRPLSTS